MLIHPFDDPLLWQGHASLIDEIASVHRKPGAVVLSVGGGGLLAGVVEGLRGNGWHDVPVIAVETEGASSLAASLAAGQRVVLPAITSIATSLGARQVCGTGLKAGWRASQVQCRGERSRGDRSLPAIRRGSSAGGGAGLRRGLGGGLPRCRRHPAAHAGDDLLVVVCGGATAGIGQLQAWQATVT